MGDFLFEHPTLTVAPSPIITYSKNVASRWSDLGICLMNLEGIEMSSVDNEPGALDGLLLECLPFVLKAETRRGGDEVRLRSFNEEAFFRQGMSIPRRLGRMVEAASGGQLTVRAASSALADKGGIGALVGEVYFVRCSPEVPDDEPVTVPTDDMILFVINRHRKLLTVNARIQPLEAIEAELVRQATERDALREAERISGENARLRQEETSAELATLATPSSVQTE